jgi:hypothetical protein
MRVLSSKVNVFEVLLAVQGRALTFGLKVDFEVHTIVNDDVQLVLELLNLISVATNIDNLLLVGLKDAMALDDLPDRLLVLGEGSELGVNLRLVGDADLLIVVLQNIFISVFDVLSIDCYNGADREREKLKSHWDGHSLKFDVEGHANYTKDLSLEADVDDLLLSRLDHSSPNIRFEESDSPGGLLLGRDLPLGLQVILVDDFDGHGLLVSQEASAEFKEVNRDHADFRHEAFSLDRHRKHVLTHTGKVDN